MVRALTFMMLAALTCVATIGCGNAGPPVIPENATNEYDGPVIGGEGTTASETLTD